MLFLIRKEKFKINLFLNIIESLFRTVISARTTEPAIHTGSYTGKSIVNALAVTRRMKTNNASQALNYNSYQSY